ncbi:MAG: hypothetical protein RMK52_08540 [Chitinophagales bacterium]|nr:hypothetical protein [Chitinophagales bacterium]
MNRWVFALTALLSTPWVVVAQNDVDALRYSLLRWSGSARFSGMSGAFSALGADFTTLSTNPAGLGLYRSSEISLSAGFTNVRTEATFLGNTSDDNLLKFNIPGVGTVFSMDLTRKNRDNEWKRVNFGLGLNRMADFNRQYRYSGFNPTSSLIDYYAAEANQNGGIAPGQITDAYPFGAGMFYQAYLINPLPSDTNQYYSVAEGGQVMQYGDIRQERNLSEMVIAVGANYNDRLLMGFTLSMAGIGYEATQFMEEEDTADKHPDFIQFSFSNSLRTTGSGIAAKGGITYLVNDYVRVGLALHSPTYYWMQDVYDAYITSRTETTGSHEWLSPLGRYDYELTTPWRLLTGAALVSPKLGILSVDYELVDYSAMRYRFRTMGTSEERHTEQQLNQLMASKYTAASTVRVGAEAVLNEFRLRAGFSYSSSPFSKEYRPADDLSRWSWSVGGGVRLNRFFADGALVWQRQNEFFQPYTLAGADVPGVSLRKYTTDIVATVGYRF